MKWFKNLNSTYNVDTVCKNCKKQQVTKVLKGVTIEGYLFADNTYCSHCGCATLEQKKEYAPINVRREKKNGKNKSERIFYEDTLPKPEPIK